MEDSITDTTVIASSRVTVSRNIRRAWANKVHLKLWRIIFMNFWGDKCNTLLDPPYSKTVFYKWATNNKYILLEQARKSNFN